MRVDGESCAAFVKPPNRRAFCVIVARSRQVRERVKRWHAAANRWIDAV